MSDYVLYSTVALWFCVMLQGVINFIDGRRIRRLERRVLGEEPDDE